MIEQDLVRRAQSGEHGAFNELVGKYRKRVMTLSMRYTGNQADAEDAVQNTFLRAYRALGGAFAAILRSILGCTESR